MTNLTPSDRRAVALEILRLVSDSDEGVARALDFYALDIAGLQPETVAEYRGVNAGSVENGASHVRTSNAELSDALVGAHEDGGGE